MKNILTGLIVLLLMIWVMVGCHRDAAKKREPVAVTPVKMVQLVKSTLKKTKPAKPKSTGVMVAPKPLQPPSGVTQLTKTIGTPEHPTIDGGVINVAGGMPGQSASPTNHPGDLTDKWMNSAKVKQLLTEAAEQGKLDYVLKKADQMNLPASVAVIPMIESHYQTNAVSAKGAVGVWQLMPAVAKDYGLTKDERSQLEPSTNAALQLLDRLHQQFGNWLFAFAAYHAGATRVQAALQKNPLATSVQELDLPAETKTYVARIIYLNRALMG